VYSGNDTYNRYLSTLPQGREPAKPSTPGIHARRRDNLTVRIVTGARSRLARANAPHDRPFTGLAAEAGVEAGNAAQSVPQDRRTNTLCSCRFPRTSAR
jgi:hypothetical protein